MPDPNGGPKPPSSQEAGATGQFPAGQLFPEDEGELRYRVGTDPSRRLVVVDFGKRISFIGMYPPDARSMALVLLKNAACAEGAPFQLELRDDGQIAVIFSPEGVRVPGIKIGAPPADKEV